MFISSKPNSQTAFIYSIAMLSGPKALLFFVCCIASSASALNIGGHSQRSSPCVGLSLLLLFSDSTCAVTHVAVTDDWGLGSGLVGGGVVK